MDICFKPQWVQEESIAVKIPEVDEGLCDGVVCVDFCKFNALAYILNKLKIFEEICHSVVVALVCPQKH